MSKANEPLQVTPAELRTAAEELDNHAAGFAEAHQGAAARAGQTALGSGLAAAALPEMLAEWENQGLRFGSHFIQHAEGHREAAAGYEVTDDGCASGIDDASAEL